MFFGIRPFVKGFFGPSVQDLPQIYKLPPPFQREFTTGIDDFVSYEGEWELEDNDLYGGTFVRLSDRVPGETHLLQTDQKMASENYCCPVCRYSVYWALLGFTGTTAQIAPVAD